MTIEQVKHILDTWFLNSEKIVIIGVGNPLRKDDAVGLEVINRLENNVSEHVYLINSETIPENYLEPISDFKPSHILIIDAALMGLEYGMIKFVNDCTISKLPFSTHGLPIQIFCTYLIESTKAKIAMLLIQPKDVSFGEGLTSELEEIIDTVISYLLDIPQIAQG